MLDLAFIREHPDSDQEVALRRKTAVDVDALLLLDAAAARDAATRRGHARRAESRHEGDPRGGRRSGGA